MCSADAGRELRHQLVIAGTVFDLRRDVQPRLPGVERDIADDRHGDGRLGAALTVVAQAGRQMERPFDAENDTQRPRFGARDDRRPTGGADRLAAFAQRAVGVFIASIFDIGQMMQPTVRAAAGFVGDGQAAVAGDAEGEIGVFGPALARDQVGGGGRGLHARLGVERRAAESGRAHRHEHAHPALAVGLEHLHPECLAVVEHLMRHELALMIDDLEVARFGVVELEVDLRLGDLLTRPAERVVDDHGRARLGGVIGLARQRAQAVTHEAVGDLARLTEAIGHLVMHLIDAAAVHIVVRVVEQQPVPGEIDQVRHALRHVRAAQPGERRERLGEAFEQHLTPVILLLEVDARRVDTLQDLGVAPPAELAGEFGQLIRRRQGGQQPAPSRRSSVGWPAR